MSPPARAAVAALPDTLLAPPETYAATRRPRLVATGYGGSLRASFSGSSYYLARAGIAGGTLDGGFTLFAESRTDRGLQLRGAAWKARRVLRRESASGFKFSPEFSGYVWHRHLGALAGADLVNNFQLYAPEVYDRAGELGVTTSFYLDGTFTDYLLGYRDFDVAALDDATIRRAVETEREGYARADSIAVMSAGVVGTLREIYGVDPARVTVVLPGANLDDDLVDAVAAARAARAPADGLTVGFVGVYPERKGLPLLARAVAQLRSDGVPVRLQVVGVCPDDIAAQDGVTFLGLIDKTAEPGRFAAAMAAVDLGCQLSTAEMWGIAALEFVRCGVPVLATLVGGIPDMVPGGGTVGLPPDVGLEQVAATIRGLVEDSSTLARLTAEAVARSGAARWEQTAATLGALVGR